MTLKGHNNQVMLPPPHFSSSQSLRVESFKTPPHFRFYSGKKHGKSFLHPHINVSNSPWKRDQSMLKLLFDCSHLTFYNFLLKELFWKKEIMASVDETLLLLWLKQCFRKLIKSLLSFWLDNKCAYECAVVVKDNGNRIWWKNRWN